MKTIKTIEMCESEYMDACEEYLGRCLACGAERGCCEPDARQYLCEECDENEVYGIEELLLMGRITIID